MTAKQLIEELQKLPPDMVVAVEDGQDPSERVAVGSVEIKVSGGGHWDPVPKGEQYAYLEVA